MIEQNYNEIRVFERRRRPPYSWHCRRKAWPSRGITTICPGPGKIDNNRNRVQRTSWRSNEEHACRGGIILQGCGENTSGIEGWSREKKRERREPTPRIGYAYAHVAYVCTYMQTRHMGRRDDRHRVVEHRAEKKNRKDGARLRTGGEKTYERKDAGRSEEAK